jgi:hypothetical protein
MRQGIERRQPLHGPGLAASFVNLGRIVAEDLRRAHNRLFQYSSTTLAVRLERRPQLPLIGCISAQDDLVACGHGMGKIGELHPQQGLIADAGAEEDYA